MEQVGRLLGGEARAQLFADFRDAENTADKGKTFIRQFPVFVQGLVGFIPVEQDVIRAGEAIPKGSDAPRIAELDKKLRRFIVVCFLYCNFYLNFLLIERMIISFRAFSGTMASRSAASGQLHR